MTRGNVPYPALESYRILDFLKSGKRMLKPETCPDEIYELMLDCWQLNFRLRPSFDQIVERIETIIKTKEREIEIDSNLTVNYENYPIEQYYSNNKKKIDELEKVNSVYDSIITRSPYYNSSLSLTPNSPVSIVFNTTASVNNLSPNKLTAASKMSTFKDQPINSKIELPGKQESITLNKIENETIYDNEDAIKLCNTLSRPLNEDEILLPRKNSNNSNSNLSFKLNRQNAIDLNEADTKTYEYVMRTPQILVDKHKSDKELNAGDELDDDDDDEDAKNFDKTTNYVHPIKYFK